MLNGVRVRNVFFFLQFTRLMKLISVRFIFFVRLARGE